MEQGSSSISSPFYLASLYTVQCMVTGDWSALDDVCQQPVQCSLLSSLSPAWLLSRYRHSLDPSVPPIPVSRQSSLSLSLSQLLSILSVVGALAPFRPTRINAAAVSTSRLLPPTCVHPLLSTSDSPVSS